MSILITAATSAQAHKLKATFNSNEKVLLGDYLDIPQFMVKSGSMLNTPGPADTAFAHKMLTLCLDNDITQIHPLRRAEFGPLAEAEQLFAEFDIKLCAAQNEFIAD